MIRKSSTIDACGGGDTPCPANIDSLLVDAESANGNWLTPRERLGTTGDDPSEESLVLIIDLKGRVRSTVAINRSQDSCLPDIKAGQQIKEYWPADVVLLIGQNSRQAIRSRQVRTERSHVKDLKRDYEFMFVAQGPDSIMLVVRDITSSQRRISRLERLAFEDPVTGLPNKEWLLFEMARSHEQQNLHGGRSALLLLELRDIELLNSISAGLQRDAILCELAVRLRQGIRGANLRDERDEERYSAVARVDSRCFGVFLPSIETGDDAAHVSTRIIEQLEMPVTCVSNGRSINVTAGIALYPQDGKSAEELYDCAFTALQDINNSITRRQQFHSGTVRMRALERQDVEAALRAALEQRDFILHYQPILECDSRRIVAAEALLRWPQPMFDSKPISEVVRVAEYTGLILPIGEWVFRTACEQIVAWHAEGHDALRISVNVSAQEFALAGLVERTRRILDATGIAPACVTLEITERLLFRDSARDYPVCNALKELGVGIAVDDYGTGVCSFDHLSRSPVDSVKIHPDFIARSAKGTPHEAACAAVTAMAHALGLKVVAEGVETQAQAEMLMALGCDYVQGYLFSVPVEPAALAALLDAAPESR
ncbi:MAG: EAL domain-containing protein [Gammaproteobacteria bacterium]|nr:EAL domain-containing protein [Gammaproteobacteria bacterium]